MGNSHKFNNHRWGAGCAHWVGKNDSEEKDFFGMLEHSLVTFGGIYIASNTSDSCRVWNCAVDPEAVGKLGDIEHLRWAMPDEGISMQRNQMYWITDRTPHESLPLQSTRMRQFFRIVTSEVSFWYKDHSTPNPLGVLPDPATTKIVVGDKFSDEGVEIINDADEKGKEQMLTEREKVKLRNQGRCDLHKSYPGNCNQCKNQDI